MRDRPMDRRTAVRRGAATLLGLGVAACAHPGAVPVPAASPAPRTLLPPPRVSEDRSIRTVAGSVRTGRVPGGAGTGGDGRSGSRG
jgi:hypothetical protein